MSNPDPINEVTGLTSGTDAAEVDKGQYIAYAKATPYTFATCAAARGRDLTGRLTIYVSATCFAFDSSDLTADDGTESTMCIHDAAGNHFVRAGAVDVPSFANMDTFADASIDVSVDAVVILGYYAAGDGGRQRRVRGTVLDATAVQSGDGAYWKLDEPVRYPEMFGAKGGGIAGDAAINDAALLAAINTLPTAGAELKGFPGAVYCISSEIVLGDGGVTGASTQQGIQFTGLGAGTSEAEYFPATASVVLKWVGVAGSTMMSVRGPMKGVKIQGLMFDCNDLAASGLNVIHADYSRFEDLTVIKQTGVAFIETALSAAYGIATGASINKWRNCSATQPGAGGSGMTIGADDYGPTDYAATISSIANPGSGYVVDEVLTLAGGTYTFPATVKVTTIGAGGSITGAEIVHLGGYSVFPGNPVAQASSTGSGIDATFNLTSGTLEHLDVARNSYEDMQLFGDGTDATTWSLKLQFVDVVNFKNVNASKSGGSLGKGIWIVPPTGNANFPGTIKFDSCPTAAWTIDPAWTGPFGIFLDHYPTGDSEPIPAGNFPGQIFGITDKGEFFGGFGGIGGLSTVASATTTVICAALTDPPLMEYVAIVGNTTIQFFDSNGQIGTHKRTYFGAAPLLTNSASLLCPGGQNFQAAAGDYLDWVYLGAGVWHCVGGLRASGQPVVTVDVSHGGTGQTTAAAARGSSGLNIESQTNVNDTDYTVLLIDRSVATNAAFSAPRTWTLPAGSTTQPGQRFKFFDKAGGVSSTNTLTIARAGADTINGGTSVVVRAAFGGTELEATGTSAWNVVRGSLGFRDEYNTALLGTPTAPTAAVNTNTTQLATTAFVLGQASAVGDGTPGMDGTAARGTSTHYARADHIHPTDTSRAPLDSPTFTTSATAPFFNATTIASGYKINGTIAMFRDATYLQFNDPSGAAKFFFGNATDPSNYLRNTTTYIQSIGGGTTFASFAAGGITLGAPIINKVYTVATLPAAAQGMIAFASDLRVFNGAGTQQGAGTGTGGMTVYNGTAWKNYDAQSVTAVA